MNVLLIRPDPGNERFGLGPFFRVEPLGLEYVAAALRQRGHDPSIVDLRFGGSVAGWMRKTRPRMVGISCMHALEYDRVVETARRIRRADPSAFILVGGHAAAAFPGPLQVPEIDAICVDDGEEVVPAVADALAAGRPLSDVPALLLNGRDGWTATAPLAERTGLDDVPMPARELVERDRNRYHCLLFKPVWLVETARGCPFRCNFCSVWQLYGRSFRERSIGAVVDDLASVGDAVFIADDLFWNHPGEEPRARGRAHQEGREEALDPRPDAHRRRLPAPGAARGVAPAREGLRHLLRPRGRLGRGAGERHQGRRRLRVDRGGADLALHGLRRHGKLPRRPGLDRGAFPGALGLRRDARFPARGYTILTPLPGTELFQKLAPILEGQPWFKYDMHHVLWEPRLGAKRFFELYAETWRRSILNTSGEKSWIEWMRQIRPSQIPYLTRVLLRTQRMMKAEAYLREHEATRGELAAAPPQALEAS